MLRPHCCNRLAGLLASLMLACLAVTAPPAVAEPRDGLDVRLLVDLSQRAHDYDPDHLRGGVLDRLVQQLPDDARSGLWGYAQFTQRMARFGPADGLWKQVASIHAEHLSPAGRKADPESALQQVLWDLSETGRARTHLVWLSDGHLDLGDPVQNSASRDRLSSRWANQLAHSRVTVHAIATGPVAETADLDLLRQLADVTGGLHRVVESQADMDRLAVDLMRLMQLQSEAVLDGQGRFQVAPGTQAITVLWAGTDLTDTTNELVQPDGTRLSRTSPATQGRWRLGTGFEVATIEQPQPGWWQAQNPQPARVAVVGDLGVQVDGLDAPVIPSDETSALIRLFSQGRRVEQADFLDLLDVRAWLVDGADRMPLPVNRTARGFEAFFVNLDDGAFDLEVQVVGPTFAQKTVVPFVARNPLRVDVRQGTAGANAWLHFNHAQVDYRTVKSVAKVRKPPQLGVMVPGQKQPNGLWQIPIQGQEGILEIAFTVSGNYLNGDGFFVKTRPVNLTLPLAPESVERFRFNAEGKQLSPVQAVALQGVNEPPLDLRPGPARAGTAVTTPSEEFGNGADAERAAPPAPTVPFWFAGLIALLNLVLAALIWWMLRPAPLNLPSD